MNFMDSQATYNYNFEKNMNIRPQKSPKVADQGALELAQQQFRTGAGGKPSTWLPPEGLVEHFHLAAGGCGIWRSGGLSLVRSPSGAWRSDVCRLLSGV